MQRLILFFFCLFSLFSLYDDLHAEPGRFAFRGEWIYFKPLLDTNYFVIRGDAEFSDPTNGTRIANNLEYSSGYRIEGIYFFRKPYDDIRLRWTRLNSVHSKSLSSDFFDNTILFPTEGASDLGISAISIGSISTKTKFHYESVDLLFTHLFYNYYPIAFFAQAGLQYAEFTVRKNTDETVFIPEIAQTEAFAFLSNNAHFWGIGPEVGLNFQYAIFNCFNCIPSFLKSIFLTLDARGALLVSSSHVNWELSFIQNGAVTISDVRDKEICRVVSAFDICLALNYEHCIGCCRVNIEVGYDFLHYVRPISTLRFDNPDFRGYSTNQFSDVSMQGPFIGVSLIF